MEVRGQNEGEPDEIASLILEPTGRRSVRIGEHFEYRRVGIAQYPPKDKFTSGWRQQMVAII
jgi:hypothetical protein